MTPRLGPLAACALAAACGLSHPAPGVGVAPGADAAPKEEYVVDPVFDVAAALQRCVTRRLFTSVSR